MIDLSFIPMPDHSRVWIYQADRKLSSEEQAIILSRGEEFTSTWNAHGKDLTASFYVIMDHFLVLVLDEQVESASGCSIDKSMRFVLDQQKDLGVSFTNRLVSSLYSEGYVRLYSYQDVKKALESGEITSQNLVFDNTIQNLNDLKASWLKPLAQTWLKKLLQSQNVG